MENVNHPQCPANHWRTETSATDRITGHYDRIYISQLEINKMN